MGSAVTRELPKFTDHEQNLKHKPLDDTTRGRPEPVILDFLRNAAARAPLSTMRILDVGCGRGSRVAWLIDEGWDAWGCDIVEDYLESARPFFSRRGWQADRLRLITGSELPFDAASFDVILSDQVIEHVADLDAFVAGIARVQRPAAHGMHVFPATWRPVEPHLRAPLVHWLPKGKARHAAISVAVRAGLSVDYFSQFDATTRTAIYARFSDEETYYRPRRQIRRAFEAHGMKTFMRSPARDKVHARLPVLPGPFVHPAAAVYSLMLQTYVTTVQL